MHTLNGTTVVKTQGQPRVKKEKEFDVSAEAINQLRIILAGINRQLDMLDKIEMRTDTLSRKQENLYDTLVDKHIAITGRIEDLIVCQ